LRRLSVLPALLIIAACSEQPPPYKPAAAPIAEAAAMDSAAIPARFRGEWNADLTACGTGRNETRLRMEERSVRFYESSGTVKAVAQPAADRLQVTLALSGEGEIWEATHEFRLSADGATLTDVAGGLVRRRCP
jgi:hypothetical protein